MTPLVALSLRKSIKGVVNNMIFDLEKSFQSLLKEYNELIAVQEHYAAASRLAQIFHCLKNTNQNFKDKWFEKLANISFSDAAVKAIKTRINKGAQRIKHVLSIGSTWNDDEVLMILQQRIFIDLFDEFFRELYKIDLQLPCEEIDDLIISTAKTQGNKQAFLSAIRLMQKNWGLPIESKWLDFSLVQD